MKRLLAPRPPSLARVLVAAVIPPAAAVGLARALGPESLAAATALALLAVVVAAAAAGWASGLLASIVSFLGLNFFFTEPRHTFVVQEPEDLIALFAFLLSALIVGALLSRVLTEASRAERRAMEAHFLNRTTARLISGEPFGPILEGFAESLVGLFALARCEIATPHGTGTASAEELAAGEGQTVTFPLATQSGTFGSLTATRAPGGPDLSASDLDVLRTLASQTALAIERAALDAEVRGVRLEAEASRLRAALFSSVTHDLRTPLSSIKASVSGLLGEDVRYSEAQREEMLRTILQEADHLNQIVGNLLDLARVRAGALVPSKQPIPIDEIVGSVLRRMSRTLQGFTVRTMIRPDLPPVDADPVQTEQVLSNLLENAIRFSPPGSEIQITAARWEGAVRVRVSDHGPGIPAEDRRRVFEEFFRRDAGTGRGGTGLGLAIARAVVVAHGGRIWAEESPGGGTAILFELPIAHGAARSVGPRIPQDGVVP